MQNQNMNLVLSTDAKPRLKWTQELHQRFVEAVDQLGGPDKATPKCLMRVMGVPGLTLYHLKSHLQKYRLGKSQHSETGTISKHEDYRANQGGNEHFAKDFNNRRADINESLQISQALQLQLELQRELHEQIKVQKRLQLGIEAQGKHLEMVLNQAQETLSQYHRPSSSSSNAAVEQAKAELSHLLSMVNATSSFSELTETNEVDFIELDAKKKQMKGTVCSKDRSLTSSESSGRQDSKLPMNSVSVELSLMDINPASRNQYSDQLPGGKRSVAQKERGLNKLTKFGMIDLNTRLIQNDIDSAAKPVDLNGMEE